MGEDTSRSPALTGLQTFKMGNPIISFLHSHWFLTLPYPTHSFAGKTIIVTGSNTGLGLESARHFVRLGATKVVLVVRSLERGQVAAESIANATGRSGVVDVWELDLASYASVKALAARAAVELERLDVVVANAAISTREFREAEDNEETVTVSLVSTMLLGLLLLPKLRETSVKLDKEVVLKFVGSFMHWLAIFPEPSAEHILAELADQKKARMDNRYVRLLASHWKSGGCLTIWDLLTDRIRRCCRYNDCKLLLLSPFANSPLGYPNLLSPGTLSCHS